MKYLFTSVAVLLLLAGSITLLPAQQRQNLFASIGWNTIDSYEACVAAGNPVVGENPARCITTDNAVYYGQVQAMDFSQPKMTATTIPPVLPQPSPDAPLATPITATATPTTVAASPTATPSPSIAAAPTPFDPLAQLDAADLPPKVILDVPFTPQAPTGNWDPPFDEACEEASVIMVQRYLTGRTLDAEAATDAIIRLTDHNRDLGYPVDTTTLETAVVTESYYPVEAKVYADEQVTIPNIKALLAAGHPVIIPAAGQLLGNPYYSGEGPPYHMLVITGYEGEEFITNDPGTRRGDGFRYEQRLILDTIHDWTGSKQTIEQGPKRMMVMRVK